MLHSLFHLVLHHLLSQNEASNFLADVDVFLLFFGLFGIKVIPPSILNDLQSLDDFIRQETEVQQNFNQV